MALRHCNGKRIEMGTRRRRRSLNRRDVRAGVEQSSPISLCPVPLIPRGVGQALRLPRQEEHISAGPARLALDLPCYIGLTRPRFHHSGVSSVTSCLIVRCITSSLKRTLSKGATKVQGLGSSSGHKCRLAAC